MATIKWNLTLLKQNLKNQSLLSRKTVNKIGMMEDSFKRIKDFEGDIKLFDAKQRRELANLQNSLEKITGMFCI